MVLPYIQFLDIQIMQYYRLRIKKKSVCKWTHAVQTHVVQGLTLHIIGVPERRMGQKKYLKI